MLDLLIVVTFVALGIGAGLAARRRASRGLDEYFLAGRSLRGWRAGLSMAATQYAADTPLLVTGLLAVSGAFALWRLWIYGLAFLLMGFVLGAAWRRAGVLTDAELTTIRYSARAVPVLRALKAIYYGTVINCVVMAFVLVAAVRIFEVFAPWHAWLPAGLYNPLLELVHTTGLALGSGATPLAADVATVNNAISIALMLTFVLLYSTTGGLRSVVTTDVVQLAFMFAGTAAFAAIAVREAGGLGALPAALEARYGEHAARFVGLTPALPEAWPAFLTVLALQWLFQVNSDGTGYLAQRTLACRDDREARIAAVIFTFVQVVARSLLWLVIGLALLVLYPFDPLAPVTETLIGAREMSFVRGVEELLPAGLRGLMLTGLLAALASTLDTHLNWGASYWSNDLYRGLWLERIRRRAPAPGELVRVARLSNLALMTLALCLMTRLESIQSAWHTSLLFGAGVGAVLVARWLWERVNLYCELAAIATSLVAAPLLMALLEDDWQQLAAMALLSTLAVVVPALLAPATEPGHLAAFYRRVQPPGWWRRTARAAGCDPAAPLRRLRRDLLHTAACAVTVYAWLIAGAWALSGTADAPACWLLAALGVAAVPLWLPAVRR